MIISEDRNFVFVHIFKTAGTSVKRAIRRFAMPAWQERANFFRKRLGLAQYGPRIHPDHMTASHLIEEMGEQAFGRLFSFAFVRNPWDWEFSHYRHIVRQRRHHLHDEVRRMAGFGEYVRWRCDNRFQLQQSFIMHRGEPVVDFVGRFENLQNDFARVCRTVGVRCRLPRLNRGRAAEYRQAYDERTAQLIHQTYLADIELFDYRFDPVCNKKQIPAGEI